MKERCLSYLNSLRRSHENLCVDCARPPKMEDNPNYSKMEDKLNFFKNGRGPQICQKLLCLVLLRRPSPYLLCQVHNSTSFGTSVQLKTHC